jgi:hypothetical protein
MDISGLIRSFDSRSTNMVVTYPQMQQLHQNTGQCFVEELPSASPTIKLEPQWNSPHNSPTFVSTNTKTVTTTPANRSNEVNFGTEVDTLMKAIQAKSESTTPQTTLSVDQSRPVVGVLRAPPYVQATSQVGAYASRESSQFKRAHTGVKPYVSSCSRVLRYEFVSDIMFTAMQRTWMRT